MKKIVIIFIVLIFTNLVATDFIVSQDIVENPANLALIRMDKNEKTDINGDLVGLVIVRTGIEDLMIDSSFKYKQEYKGGEYYVFLSPGTKYITFKKRGFANYKYSLRKFIGKIKSGYVYEMVLTQPIVEVKKHDLTLIFNQPDPFVSIDNKTPIKIKGNTIMLQLAEDNHDLSFELMGYETITKKINIDRNTEQHINFVKSSKIVKPKLFGFLEIVASLKDCQIYLNEVLVGTPPITLDVLPGDIEVIVRKKGFVPYISNVKIIQNETKSLSVELNKIETKEFALQLSTILKDSKLWIDNKEVGDLPYSGKITSGIHELVIKKEFYEDYVIKKNFVNDFILSEIEMLPNYSEILITNKNTKVYIDDKQIETNKKVKLNYGKHFLIAKQDGYSDYYEKIELAKGQLLEKQLTLSPKYASSSFKIFDFANPGIDINAEISFDDTTITTPSSVILLEKPYKLTIEKENYATLKELISPVSGTVNKYEFSLYQLEKFTKKSNVYKRNYKLGYIFTALSIITGSSMEYLSYSNSENYKNADSSENIIEYWDNIGKFENYRNISFSVSAVSLGYSIYNHIKYKNIVNRNKK